MNVIHLCRIEWCNRRRTPLSLYCRDHLTDVWMNRMPEDPTMNERAEAAGIGVPEWRRRLIAKDFTGSAA